jgi:FAD/FMN-containing dehydrogenase
MHLHPRTRQIQRPGMGETACSYRDNYDRLVEIKTRYDPDNLFRVNQNIRPSV